MITKQQGWEYPSQACKQVQSGASSKKQTVPDKSQEREGGGKIWTENSEMAGSTTECYQFRNERKRAAINQMQLQERHTNVGCSTDRQLQAAVKTQTNASCRKDRQTNAGCRKDRQVQK